MGQAEAEVTEEIETEEVITENPEELETDIEPVIGEDGEEVVSEEVDIVRDAGESQPLPAKQTGFQKRVNKLNAKIDAANQQAEGSNAEVAILQERLKIQEIALEQARGSQSQELKAPNPDDYEAGEYDAEFIKKKDAYQDARLKKEVADAVAQATQQTAQTNSNTAQSSDLEAKQVSHYERAEKLKVKDYGAVEDIAIENLGLANVNYIVSKFSDSQNILYYLGKNPAEAEALKNLAAKDSDMALVELGRLQALIKVKPKSKTHAPNPDEELAGGGLPRDAGANERKLDNLRKAAQSGNRADMEKLIAFKKKLKAVAKV